jgi:riboflavin kinase/FMN adenylyltransferase
MEKKYVNGFAEVGQEYRNCVLTIGNFDGVHLGHQRILLGCRTQARRRQSAVVVVTFDPLPEAVLSPTQAAPPLICPLRQNGQTLMRHGADLVVIVPTTRELLSLRPREFINRLVVKHLGPWHMVEGSNFFFGRGRAGTVETLEQLGAEYGFGLSVVDPVVVNLPEGERRISSTLIRELILAGRIEDANFCLGREFVLYGTVVRGRGRGRALEFPTANLDAHGQITPGDGIYAAFALLGERKIAAAVSIGRNPTFGPGPRSVEAFLLDTRGDLYGQDLAVSFVRRLRDQRKFEDAQDLRKQIAKDVENVRKLLD